MFLTQPVAGAPDVGIALPVRNIFALIHHVHSAKDDVVVDVPFVNVRCLLYTSHFSKEKWWCSR